MKNHLKKHLNHLKDHSKGLNHLNPFKKKHVNPFETEVFGVDAWSPKWRAAGVQKLAKQNLTLARGSQGVSFLVWTHVKMHTIQALCSRPHTQNRPFQKVGAQFWPSCLSTPEPLKKTRNTRARPATPRGLTTLSEARSSRRPRSHSADTACTYLRSRSLGVEQAGNHRENRVQWGKHRENMGNHRENMRKT